MIFVKEFRTLVLSQYEGNNNNIQWFNASFFLFKKYSFPKLFSKFKIKFRKKALNHIQGVHNFDSGPPKLDSLTPTFVIKDLTIAWGSSYLNIFCLIGKDLLDPQQEKFHIKTFLPLGKIKMEIFHLIHDKHICP